MSRDLNRSYGYFRCSACKSGWESSHVYCTEDTTDVAYGQECKSCKETCMPYKVEPIRCSLCGNTECTCTKEERAARHVDPNKPHRSDLCLKCRAGDPCNE